MCEAVGARESLSCQAASGVLEPCEVLDIGSCDKNGGIRRLVLRAPHAAIHALPGQFVHLRIPHFDDHLLRRPFGLYRCNSAAGTIELVYQVLGAGTQQMTSLKVGQKLDIIGPVGRGWSCAPEAKNVLLIAGGMGAVPLYPLAEQLKAQGKQVQVVLGAQNADLLVFQKDFETLLGAENIPICTDDGSAGFHGFTTERAAELLKKSSFDAIATCGPHLMQRGVALLARKAGIPCEVSLEERMACGIGACLSCVVETTAGKKRACVDGPVFKADEVIWND